MGKRLLSLFTILVCVFQGISQNKYIVFFKDKDDISLFSTEQLVSTKCIEKRFTHGLGIDEYDLPVKLQYLQALTDNGLKILSVSKWLNAAIIEASQASCELAEFIFIEKTVPVSSEGSVTENKFSFTEKSGFADNILIKQGNSSISYGKTTRQNLALEIDYLHDKGFLGEGVSIAFLDVGFPGLDTISYFNHVFDNNRVIDTYDFWSNTEYTYHKDSHGTHCSSEVIAYKPGQSEISFVGMAPNVNLMFYITDDIRGYQVDKDDPTQYPH